jgi:hypothetical protein
MPRAHLRLKEGQWNLWRLTDEEFATHVHKSLRITQNYTVILRTGHRQLANGRRMSLGEAHIVLQRRFGETSLAYDGFRGSFCFPLLLTFEHAPRLTYLVRVHDHRGTIFFPLFRVIDREPTSAERARHHTSFAHEFSTSEIAAFTTCFFQYLLAGTETLSDSFVTPFYRAIESNRILYGCENGEFFEQSYADLPSFTEAREELEKRIGGHRAYDLLLRDRWSGPGALET